MRDTLQAQCVLEAITRYNEAKSEHDKARDAYDGPSWGYYGSEYIDRMEDAAELFQNQFRDFISHLNSQQPTTAQP